MSDSKPIHITLPGCPDDPRVVREAPEGVVFHHAPGLHPDDVCEVDGLLTTTPSRTLIDLAEVVDRDELADCFKKAHELGLLEGYELAAARSRVEWRPSLAMLDEVIAEFCGPLQP